MGRFVQLVLGPAGSGKSTYCHTMEGYFEASKRPVNFINLDPAAENFSYNVSVDVRDLISLEDVTGEDLAFGPNGGLVFCMEHLCQNLDWLQDEMEKVGGSDDEYFIIDCPGQIELFTHIPVMRQICFALQSWGYRVCAVYLIDSMFIDDPAKYISGTMMALSTMAQLEVPHISVISKCDMLENRKGGADTAVDPYLKPDTMTLREQLDKVHQSSSQRFRGLHDAICNLLDDYSMVQFVSLDINSEDSIEYVLANVDNAMQYGEDLEPMDPGELEDPDDQ